MKNIKRILNLILIILVILSTFVVTKSFALVFNEMEATGISSHMDKDLTLPEYRDNYDIFCSMMGIPAADTGYDKIIIDGKTITVDRK